MARSLGALGDELIASAAPAVPAPAGCGPGRDSSAHGKPNACQLLKMMKPTPPRLARPPAAEVIQIMSLMGFEGRVALTRAADEELLHILHFRRRAEGPAAAAEAAAASTGPQAGLDAADGRGSQAPGQQAAGPEQPAASTHEVAAGQQAGPVQAVA